MAPLTKAMQHGVGGIECCKSIEYRQLTSYETSVLSKGLSFIPVTKADSFTTRVELFKFLRPIKLKAFFAKADDSASPQQTVSDVSCRGSILDQYLEKLRGTLIT